MDNSVFISYRRNVSAFTAHAVFQDLRANNIDAFIDVESIDMGQFDTIILNQIAARPYFVLILTPGTLDRCVEPSDWLLREIEHAMNLNRNIIPLVTNSFTFDDAKKFMQEPIKSELSRWNAVNVPYDYFEEAMARLRTRFLKPIDLPLTPTPKADQAAVERNLKQVSGEPAVTEKQLTAQEYFERGLARAKNDIEGKIADYSEAIRLNPEFARAYSGRGLAYEAKGDSDRAINDFDQALSIQPKDVEGYYGRGNARRGKGDTDGAIAEYSEAIRLNPKFGDAYYNRGVEFQAKGDIDGAIADYNEAIRLDPNDAESYNNRGLARKDKGEIDGAIADYSEAIRLDPKFALAYTNRGNANLSLNNDHAAVADYEKALELNPNDPRSRVMRNFIAMHKK